MSEVHSDSNLGLDPGFGAGFGNAWENNRETSAMNDVSGGATEKG